MAIPSNYQKLRKNILYRRIDPALVDLLNVDVNWSDFLSHISNIYKVVELYKIKVLHALTEVYRNKHVNINLAVAGIFSCSAQGRATL